MDAANRRGLEFWLRNNTKLAQKSKKQDRILKQFTTKEESNMEVINGSVTNSGDDFENEFLNPTVSDHNVEEVLIRLRWEISPSIASYGEIERCQADEEAHRPRASAYQELEIDDGWNGKRRTQKEKYYKSLKKKNSQGAINNCQKYLSEKENEIPPNLHITCEAELSSDDGWSDYRMAYQQRKAEEQTHLEAQIQSDHEWTARLNENFSASFVALAGGNCQPISEEMFPEKMSKYFIANPPDEWVSEWPKKDREASQPKEDFVKGPEEIVVGLHEESDDNISNSSLFATLYASTRPKVNNKPYEMLDEVSIEDSWTYGMLLSCLQLSHTHDLEIEVLNFHSKAVARGIIRREIHEFLMYAEGLLIRWKRHGQEILVEDGSVSTAQVLDPTLYHDDFVRVKVIGLSSYVNNEFWKRYRRTNVRNLKFSWPIWTPEFDFLDVPCSALTTCAQNENEYGTLKACIVTVDIRSESGENGEITHSQTIHEVHFLDFFEKCFTFPYELSKFDALTLDSLQIQHNGKRKYLFKSAIFPGTTFEAFDDLCEDKLENYYKLSIVDPKEIEGQKLKEFQGVFCRHISRENTFCAMVVGCRTWIENETEERILNFTLTNRLEMGRKQAQGEIKSKFPLEQLHNYVNQKLIRLSK